MNQRAALVQPHSTEAEMSVLGSMMLDSSALEKVVEILQPEDFYYPAHQILYGAMLSLHERNYAVDLLTVQEELRRHGQLEEAGGLPALVNIVESVPTAANAEHYARIVKEKAILRRLLRAAHEIVRLVEEPELEVQQILDQAEHAIYQVAEQRLGREFAEVGHLIVDVMGRLEERQQHLQEHPGEFLQGVSTGFRELDWILSGLKPSELIILAARPSVGKTSLAVNIAEHVAIRERKAVAVFSLEMSAEQLVQRMLCSQAGVNAQRLRRLQLNQDEWNLLTRAAERLFQAQIYIDDTSSLSPIEMRAKCRRLKSRLHGRELGLIVVDYLQLMRSSNKRVENRNQEIGEIARALKQIAREFHVPCWCCRSCRAPSNGARTSDRCFLTCATAAPSRRRRMWCCLSTAKSITATARRRLPTRRQALCAKRRWSLLSPSSATVRQARSSWRSSPTTRALSVLTANTRASTDASAAETALSCADSRRIRGSSAASDAPPHALSG